MRRQRIIMRLIPGVVLFLLSLLLTPPISNALTYQYNYTGKNFTSAQAPYTTSDFVTISFSIDHLLTTPIPQSPSTSDSTLYTISDGLITGNWVIPSLGSHIDALDSNGLPTKWLFMFDDYRTGLPHFVTSAHTGDSAYLEWRVDDGRDYALASVDGPGVWTVTVTPDTEPIPEPSTILLLIIGLGGMTAISYMMRKAAAV